MQEPTAAGSPRIRVVIDGAQLTANARAVRSILRPGTATYYMVKGNAYGYGLEQAVPALAACPPDVWVVDSIEEAVRVRRLRPDDDILVLQVWSGADLVEVARLGARATISDLAMLREWVALGGSAPCIELQLEVGMQRLGFVEGDIDEMIDLVASNGDRWVGVFAHIGRYDVEQASREVHRFSSLVDRIATRSGRPRSSLRTHLSSSRGITADHSLEFDAVRVGRALYGSAMGLLDSTVAELVQPALSLEARVARCRPYDPAYAVGYAGWTAEGAGVSADHLSIATLYMGYNDVFGLAPFIEKLRWESGGRTVRFVEISMQYSLLAVSGPPFEEGEWIRFVDSRTAAGKALLHDAWHGYAPQRVAPSIRTSNAEYIVE